MTKNKEKHFYRRNLPHFREEGACYFVTWRLHPKQSPLTPDERTIVTRSLLHFDQKRYDLNAWVVMDDHVHAMVRPLAGFTLSSILHSWKSFSANEIAKGRQNHLGAIAQNRLKANNGLDACSAGWMTVWQDESFDRIMRDESEWIDKMAYILGNPQKRWPDMIDYPWVNAVGFAS